MYLYDKRGGMASTSVLMVVNDAGLNDNATLEYLPCTVSDIVVTVLIAWALALSFFKEVCRELEKRPCIDTSMPGTPNYIKVLRDVFHGGAYDNKANRHHHDGLPLDDIIRGAIRR